MRLRILLLTSLLPGLLASASVLSPEEALQRAFTSVQLKISSNSQPQLVQAFERNGVATSYLFSQGDKGFFLLSADNCAEPILAYSESTVAGELPCAMRMWVDFYNDRIEQARIENIRVEETTNHPHRDPIPQMLHTYWGQQEPYNYLMPMSGEHRCVTGCVATALAQVLKYYGSAVKGTGEHTIEFRNFDVETGTPKIEHLSYDFENADFRWGKMLDSYANEFNQEEAEAVAQLMLACGISVEMNYGSISSGAISTYLPAAVYRFFGVNAGVRCIKRDNFYPQEDWVQFVYDRLATQGPLLYCGVTSENEGHAFVCDGYSEDGFFHFNWGWNGLSDGYFRLDALAPAVQGTGGSSRKLPFNFNQDILAFVDFTPSDAEYVPLVDDEGTGFKTSTKKAKLGDNFTLVCTYINREPLPYHIEFGVLITDSERGEDGIVLPVRSSEMQPLELCKIFEKIALPDKLEEGIYCLRPAYRWDDHEDWIPMQWSLERGACIWAEVKDSEMVFNVDAPNEIDCLRGDTTDTQYFNLNGISVNAPEEGQIYIVKRGNMVIKEMYSK